MKTRSLLLLVPVAALAITYFTWEPGNSGSTAEPGSADEIPTSAGTQITAPTTPNPIVAAETAPVGDSTVERGCELLTHYLPVGDGTVVEAVSCEPISPVEQHPYGAYSSAALESLAYSDAKAAEILGMRMSERDEARALSLILRSSALSGGDVAPILLYSQSYPEPSAVDGVPVRKTIHTKFVLSSVVDLLSTDTQYAAPWEDVIRRYSSDPDVEIAMLRKQANRIVAEMRQIQLDVSGTSNIGGQGDA